jgi:hypothetical protein
MPTTAIDPSSLYSLVYTSTASRPLAKGDLENILSSARKRNLEEGVTGLLLFTEGKFMQYLEGPQAGVLKIFDIIKTSGLHKDITEVSRQPLGRREYGDWSMAFLADVDAHALPRSGEDAALIHGLEAQATDASSAAHDQMSEFWKKP